MQFLQLSLYSSSTKAWEHLCHQAGEREGVPQHSFLLGDKFNKGSSPNQEKILSKSNCDWWMLAPGVSGPHSAPIFHLFARFAICAKVCNKHSLPGWESGHMEWQAQGSLCTPLLCVSRTHFSSCSHKTPSTTVVPPEMSQRLFVIILLHFTLLCLLAS